MKNKCYRQSKMKKQLNNKREQGIETVVWKLDEQQKRDIEELGYLVKPFIYLIETRAFYDVKGIRSSLLKDLHYAKKNNKHYVIRPLKKREVELLDEYGINYKVHKYKIYLR